MSRTYTLYPSVMSDSLRPHGPYSPWNSPGQNTGVGSRSLLQGIFQTQVSHIAGGFFTSWATREAQRNEPKEIYKLLPWPNLVKRNTVHQHDAFFCKANVTSDKCEE